MQNYFCPVLTDDAIRGLSSLGLAHVGDAVYELLVRTWLSVHGRATGHSLHQASVTFVRAEAQAAGAARIVDSLTEQEADVFRRGRNAHPHAVPPHASRAQYATATALEALFGWLYLTGQQARANELFCRMMEGES